MEQHNSVSTSHDAQILPALVSPEFASAPTPVSSPSAPATTTSAPAPSPVVARLRQTPEHKYEPAAGFVPQYKSAATPGSEHEYASAAASGFEHAPSVTSIPSQLCYRLARPDELHAIYDLVQRSIAAAYPKVYPQEVVRFFQSYHSKAAILTDVQEGLAYLAFDKGTLVGTGCYKEDRLSRLYIDPVAQGCGVGSFLMDVLESTVAQYYNRIELDAALSAVCWYERRGYYTLRHEQEAVQGNAMLVWAVMEKSLGTCQSE